jgi:cytochrome P450
MTFELRDDFSSLSDLRTYLGTLRSEGDIFQVNPKTYVVTDYEIMKNIFRRSEDFRTFDFGDRIHQLLKRNPSKFDFGDIRDSMSNWLLFMDGPAHLAWKKRMMQRMYGLDLSSIILTEWNEVASLLKHVDHFDLIKDLCEPLITRILCAILGFDPNIFKEVRELEKIFIKALVPSMSLESLNSIKKAHHAFRDLQYKGWQEGTLLQARLIDSLLKDMDPMDADDIFAQMEFVLSAGVESSILLFTESIFRLLTDLQEEVPSLMIDEKREVVVEELIRMSSTVSVATRRVLNPVTINGVPIDKDMVLLLFVASANREPGYFPFPDKVHEDNLKFPHLAFGMGRHHCMGSELSRLEMKIILPAFFKEFGDSFMIEPNDREKITKSFYVPGIEQIRVTRIKNNDRTSVKS